MIVIPMGAFRKLRWFFSTVGKPIFYYTEMLDKFSIVEDDRFTCGMWLMCNNCGSLAHYIREDWCSSTRNWLIVHVVCGMCLEAWKVEGIQPMYDRLLTDWDLEAECRWEYQEI